MKNQKNRKILKKEKGHKRPFFEKIHYLVMIYISDFRIIGIKAYALCNRAKKVDIFEKVWYN